MTIFSQSKLPFAVCFSAALGASAAPVAADEIAITGLDWDAGKVIAQVLKDVIEAEYGEVAIIRVGTTQDSLISMDTGNGQYDVFPDLWMPNQKDAWNRYVVDRGTIRHNSQPYKTTQGFFISSEIAHKYQLRTIDDLRRPDIIGLFDSDGDGMGEYWAGDEKWGASKINQVKMHSYGLSELWEPIMSSNTEFKNILSSAMDSQQPLLFYHWQPEWIFGAYKISQVMEPEYYKGCDEMYQAEDRPDWLEASKHPCAFEDGDVSVVYSSSLEVRFPKVANFLSVVHFTPDTINQWVTATGIGKKTPTEVADEWVSKNARVIMIWVADAAELSPN